MVSDMYIRASWVVLWERGLPRLKEVIPMTRKPLQKPMNRNVVR